MVLTFKDYTSLLEIRFDIENELNTKIDNIWFVYSKKSISAKTIKPICVIYEASSTESSTGSSTESSADSNQKHLSISELNELLGFIPCIATDVKKAKERTDPYGIITIHKDKFTNVFHKEDSAKIAKYETTYNAFMSGGSASSTSAYTYEKDINDFKTMGIEVKPSDAGIIFDDVVMTKNKALCEQEYNIKSKYRHLMLIDKNSVMGTLGRFYVYDGTSTYPIEENLAILAKCKRCGELYVQNYFVDFKGICPKCNA